MNILRILPTLLLAFITVSTVAFAQSTFNEPSTAAPGANIAPPVTQGSTFQQKSGNLSSSNVGSTNGFVLQTSAGIYPWDLEYSTTQLSSNLFTTFNTQQICIGAQCITSLGSIVPTYDIYLNSGSCEGRPCVEGGSVPNETATKICTNNGYSHLVSVIGGADGSSGNYWTGSAWQGNGCTSSCKSSGFYRVTCDDNP